MFLLRQLTILSSVWFVSDEHHVHYGQHLPGDGDDSFAGAMLPFDAFVEFSHSRVVLSGGLGALAEDPSCSFAAFLGDMACPVGFAGLMHLRC
jgi:hypothetical protein